LTSNLARADSTASLAQILDNSGIFAAGYASAGYTAGFNKGQTLSARVFDRNSNSFELNQAALILAHAPDAGDGFGGKLVMIAGSDARVFNAFYGSGSSDFALFIAQLQYASGPLTVTAGRFPALSGYELAPIALNDNLSRSLVLALAQPVPLTGVRASYKLSDEFTGVISISNSDSFGSAAALDDNKQKTLEFGGSFTPGNAFMLAVYDYYGVESQANGGKNDMLDLVASYQATPQLKLALNADYKRMFDTTPASDAGATYGAAAYATYQFAVAWSGSLRLEYLSLTDHLRQQSTQLQEVTATARYTASRHLRVLGEVRYDHASDKFFADGSDLGKHDSELRLNAIYSFGGV